MRDPRRADELDAFIVGRGFAEVVEQPLAPSEQDRNDRHVQVVHEPGPEVLLDRRSTTAEPHVATAGRFVFTPALWQVLDDAALDQAALPVAIRALMERERVFACLVEGRRFDCGSKLGFLEAQFAYAQKRGELWSGLRQSLGDLLAHADAPPPAAAAMLTASAATASTEPARDS